MSLQEKKVLLLLSFPLFFVSLGYYFGIATGEKDEVRIGVGSINPFATRRAYDGYELLITFSFCLTDIATRPGWSCTIGRKCRI